MTSTERAVTSQSQPRPRSQPQAQSRSQPHSQSQAQSECQFQTLSRRRRRWRPAARSRAAYACWLLEEAVAAAFAVPVDDVRAPSRSRADVALARQCAMYLANVALGANCDKVGRLFHRDRKTVSYACRRVELLRDDPVVDRLLDMLEEVCIDLARAVLQPRVPQ